MPSALLLCACLLLLHSPPPCVWLSPAGPLKLALQVEAQAWKQAYGRSLNAHYRTKMEKIVHFVTEYQKRLSRPVQDLEDVRLMMAALAEIRDGEIGIDVELIPVEVRVMHTHVRANTHTTHTMHTHTHAHTHTHTHTHNTHTHNTYTHTYVQVLLLVCWSLGMLCLSATLQHFCSSRRSGEGGFSAVLLQ